MTKSATLWVCREHPMSDQVAAAYLEEVTGQPWTAYVDVYTP